MSASRIKLEKGLLGYTVWIDTCGSGAETHENYQSLKPSVPERVSKFVDEMRGHLMEAGLPDPLRLVSTGPNVEWQYRDVSECKSSDVCIGYQFAIQHMEVSDVLREKLLLLSQAVNFLGLHDAGDTEAAYDCLFEFTQSYTLYWAGIDARPDMERGQSTVKAASAGGEQRARGYHARNSVIIREIEKLKATGHSAKRAAELTAKRGFGTSAAANLAVWNRRDK